jgi:acetylornithine deacetylase/succinyl-diaminopimelate desuccinylase-like protein
VAIFQLKTTTMQALLPLLEANKDKSLQELIALLRFPSVSADPTYKNDVLACADFVADALRKAGADKVEICPTRGYPIIVWREIMDASKPTVLVYGHYDVQPADPLELWTSPSF